MPSPFPGMDPYLENPVLWPGLHLGLIADLQSTLNRQLRPRYLARVEERVYISDETDPGRAVIIPDVQLFSGASSNWKPMSPSTSAVSTIEPMEVTTFVEDEIREPRIVVLDTETRSVVCLIEILSPSNKTRGSRGYDTYLTKRREIMTSTTHLVEIDLLRAGARIFVMERLPEYDYLVHVSRSQNPGRRRAKVWPIPLASRLPAVPIPLLGDDPDAQVDLQDILNSAYERAAYDEDIDYTRDPQPPLTAEQATWARQAIQQPPPIR